MTGKQQKNMQKPETNTENMESGEKHTEKWKHVHDWIRLYSIIYAGLQAAEQVRQECLGKETQKSATEHSASQFGQTMS